MNRTAIEEAVVPPLVPALGTLLQRFVIPILILLDQALQADVAPDFITQLIALQQP